MKKICAGLCFCLLLTMNNTYGYAVGRSVNEGTVEDREKLSDNGGSASTETAIPETEDLSETEYPEDFKNSVIGNTENGELEGGVQTGDKEKNIEPGETENPDSDDKEKNIKPEDLVSSEVNNTEESGTFETEGTKELLSGTEGLDDTESTDGLDAESIKADLEIEKSWKLAGNSYSVTAVSGCNATALQKLFDLNKTGKYNLTVNIPAGTYILKKTLYIYPNTSINALPGAVMVKNSGYGAMLEAKLVNDSGGYDGNHHIMVNGGIWDSTPIKNKKGGTETFRFIHCNNIKILNAVFTNVPEGSHHIVFAGVRDAAVTNCSFSGYGDDGDAVETQKEAVQLDIVHSSQVVPTAQHVKWDDLSCTNITISGCEFFDYSRGVGSHTAVAGRFHSKITIQNNNFHDLAESAIRLYNYKDSVVSGNKINKVAEGVIAYTYMEKADGESYYQPLDGKTGAMLSDYNIRITGNTITNIKLYGNTWGDAIRVIGGSGRKLSGVEITGNVIQNTDRYGIFVTMAPGIVISGSNTLQAARKDGILVEESEKAQVYGNVVKKSGKSGIAFYYSDQCRVYSNMVQNAGTDGIYLLQSRESKIGAGKGKGNVIIKPGKSGIRVSSGSSSAEVANNIISQYSADSSAESYAIYMYRSAGSAGSNAKVQNNSITGEGGKTRRDAIRISGSPYILISGNTITNPDGCGVYVYNSQNCTVGNSSSSYNEIKKSRGPGIYFSTGSKSGKIKYNKITDSDGDGICVSDSSAAVIWNNRVSARDNGIYIKNKSSGASVKNNSIDSTGKHGIWLSDQSKTASVSGNKIREYGASGYFYGIYVEKSGGTSSKKVTLISRNTVNGSAKSNKQDAVRVSGSSYTNIFFNKITSAGGSGIYIVKSKNCIIGGKKNGNTITKPGSYGIYLSGSSHNGKVEYNKITGSKRDGVLISKTTGVIVRENSISAKGHGIYLNGRSTRSLISKNKITSAGKNGIWISGKSTETKVIGNTVGKYALSEKYSGIYITQSGGNSSKSRSYVKENKVTGSGKSKSKDAIRLSGSSYVTVEKNTVKSAAGTGIYLQKSKYCRITKNTINSSKNRGIYVASNCKKTNITSNTVTGSGNLSIGVSNSADGTISSNKITMKEGRFGIWVNKSNRTKITSNTIKGSSSSKAVVTVGSKGCTRKNNRIHK